MWSFPRLFFFFFALTGGMAGECSICFKRIADLLSNKKQMSFSQVLHLIRCQISFALLRSAIRAIKGSQQLRSPAGDCVMDFNRAYTEGHLQLEHVILRHSLYRNICYHLVFITTICAIHSVMHAIPCMHKCMFLL